MDCDIFQQLQNNEEKRSWYSCKVVAHGFNRNHRAENDEELITDIIISGYRMSLKMHMLHSHFDKDNIEAYSEEQGERFHQDIMQFDKRYQDRYTESILGDNIWGFKRETSTEHDRK